MKLLVILLVLALRRRDGAWPLWLSRDDRHERWLDRLSPTQSPGLNWWLAVALPSLLLALLLAWFAGGAGALLTLIAGTLVLLWLVGVDSEFRQLDTVLTFARLNDQEGLNEALQDAGAPETRGSGLARERPAQPAGRIPETDEEPSADEEPSSTPSAFFLQKIARLFAVLFWVTVLGFGAALLMVLNHAWLRRGAQGTDGDAPATEAVAWATSLDAALIWIPHRLTVLALALVGHFGAVAGAVAGRLWRLDDSEALLADAADAACEHEAVGTSDDTPDDAPEPRPGLAPLEALNSLLLRALAVWLIFIALWVVLAA